MLNYLLNKFTIYLILFIVLLDSSLRQKFENIHILMAIGVLILFYEYSFYTNLNGILITLFILVLILSSIIGKYNIENFKINDNSHLGLSKGKKIKEAWVPDNPVNIFDELMDAEDLIDNEQVIIKLRSPPK